MNVLGVIVYMLVWALTCPIMTRFLVKGDNWYSSTDTFGICMALLFWPITLPFIFVYWISEKARCWRQK